jgi:hypothetical protein
MPSAKILNIITGAENDPNRINYWGSIKSDDPLSKMFGDRQKIQEFEGLLNDPDCRALFNSRVRETLQRPLIVSPFVSEDGKVRSQDEEFADFVQSQLYRATFKSRFDNACAGLLEAIFTGYKVAENIFGRDRSYTTIEDLRVRESDRFDFFPLKESPKRDCMTVNGYELRYFKNSSFLILRDHSTSLPKGKFTVFSYGANNANPKGNGLGNALYWLRWFNDEMMKSVLIYGERFAQPTFLGKYAPGADKQTLNQVLANLAGGRYASLPKGLYEIDLLEAQRSSSQNFYEWFFDFIHTAKSSLIVGERHGRNAQQGLAGRPAEKDAESLVKIAKFDSDLLNAALTEYLIAPLAVFNRNVFGDANPPLLERPFPELQDNENRLRAIADRDEVLYRQGWRRSPESFAAVYGEGYIDKEGKEGGAESGEHPPEEALDPADKIAAILDKSEGEDDNDSAPESTQTDSERPPRSPRATDDETAELYALLDGLGGFFGGRQSEQFAAPNPEDTRLLRSAQLESGLEDYIKATSRELSKSHQSLVDRLQQMAKQQDRAEIEDPQKFEEFKKQLDSFRQSPEMADNLRQFQAEVGDRMEVAYLVGLYMQHQSEKYQ